MVLKTKQKTRGSSAFSASPGHFHHKGVNIDSSLGVASSCILLSEAQTCRSHILSLKIVWLGLFVSSQKQFGVVLSPGAQEQATPLPPL